MSAALEEIKTTCPRDCYDACGIKVVKERGVIIKVMGDPDHAHNHGTLCGKCTLAYNGAWRDSSARLAHPLRRTGPKGSAQFTQVSWDEAIGEIAEHLQTVVAENGGGAVLQTHYTGTCSLIAYSFPLRFFNKIGATEVDPDTVCNKAGHVVLETMFGTSLTGFDPRTAKDSNCLIVWGANPSAAAPNTHRYWLSEFPGKVIVIDPIRHPTAQAADIHLQLRPGSDAALAFALLHVIEREGLLDIAFLDSAVTGWDEVRPLIADCTPEWGETVTGVPAEKIVAAAKIYGQGPSLLWLGQGLQRQSTGGNVFRSCSLLPIATGNIGKPGAGFLYMNGTADRGIDGDYLPATHLNKAPQSISHMDFAERLENIAVSRALFCWNNNIVASCPQQTRLKKALEREDLFTVAIDLFPTDTTDYADIVLPAASFLEFDDLVLSYFNYSVSAQVKVSEPIGESLPNQEIFRRLALKMGYTESELFEPDITMIANLLKQTGLPIDFAGLSTAGTVDYSPDPVIQFSDRKFPTPSGKVEIVSDRFEAAGLPRAPQPFAGDQVRDGRLRLLSPASPWLMNSSYDNVSKIRDRNGVGDVTLHPDEAKLRGLVDGSDVVLFNEVGRLPLRLIVSENVPLGVALVPKGRWPKLDPARANVNVLNPGNRTDLAHSSAVHSIEVEICAA